MIKNIILSFFIVVCCAFNFNHQQLPKNFVCKAPELKEAIARISKVPEIVEKINKITAEGAITVKMEYNHGFEFEALWNSSSRTIVVNGKHNKQIGEIITSILFELHNAKSDKMLCKYFQMAERGLIEKEAYVRAIEKMEHDNALETIELLNLGISRGAFPKSAEWNIYKDFEDHYKLQQLHNHSQWIAEKYDQICPRHMIKEYKGTLPNLQKLSKQDKEDLARFLSIKNRLSHSNIQVRKNAAQEEQQFLNHFQFCKNRTYMAQCKRHMQEERLYQAVFN